MTPLVAHSLHWLEPLMFAPALGAVVWAWRRERAQRRADPTTTPGDA